MIDQSGGKGRVFVHPALAEELFPPSSQIINRTITETERFQGLPHNLSQPTSVEEANAKLLAFRQTVATAFNSLQAFKDIRRVDAGAPWTRAQPSPPAQATSPSCSSGSRTFGAVSGNEDTEDLDALLSSDDEDDEVTSTAHSSEQSADEGKGESERWAKRRKLEGEEGEGARSEQQELEMEGGKARNSCRQKEQSKECDEEVDSEMKRKSLNKEGIARKLKIKSTVKTLRKMIPGGSCLDAALVLEETILYVKILRDRINQLEATRFPYQP